MIYIYLKIEPKELQSLLRRIPPNQICLFPVERGAEYFAGIIEEEVYTTFIHTLTAQTLQELEYLEEEELKDFCGQRSRADDTVGNHKLLEALAM